MLNNKSIFVTGATGSFGKAFIRTVLQRYPDIARLVVFSRDELKQFEMEQEISESEFPAMQYMIGDIRDESRLRRAMDGIDIVVHAAALKQVVAAEQNPFEFIMTNVLGSRNIVEAALDAGVSKVVALSTDKAAAPINLYGATKLCSDKLFVAANNIVSDKQTRLSVVRYGNVMGARGSVIPFFMDRRESGVLPITDAKMTRFNISLEDGVEMVLWTLENALGGEIFVPKIPSYLIGDLAEALAPSCEQKIIGIRPGEKIHEEMITSSDSPNTVDLGKYYAILPSTGKGGRKRYLEHKNGTAVPNDFSYNSETNSEYLTVEEIRSLVKKHLYSDFAPL